MSLPNNADRQSFKGGITQSCVNIDRRKEEMIGQDERRTSGGGKGEGSKWEDKKEKNKKHADYMDI